MVLALNQMAFVIPTVDDVAIGDRLDMNWKR